MVESMKDVLGEKDRNLGDIPESAKIPLLMEVKHEITYMQTEVKL